MEQTDGTPEDEFTVQERYYLMNSIRLLVKNGLIERNAGIAIEDYLNLLPDVVNHPRRAPHPREPIGERLDSKNEAKQETY
jgi:hypothetical protein